MTPQDPLIALWQTAPQPDPRHGLIEDIQRLNRLHRRTTQGLVAILCGIAVLLIYQEATVRLPTRGFLSAIWILTLAIVLPRQFRPRASLLTLDTITILRTMLTRAKQDLLLARCLYAGVPVGALTAFCTLRLARFTPIPSSPLQTALALAIIALMIVTGLLLARSRGPQVRTLKEKLTDFESTL